MHIKGTGLDQNVKLDSALSKSDPSNECFKIYFLLMFFFLNINTQLSTNISSSHISFSQRHFHQETYPQQMVVQIIINKNSAGRTPTCKKIQVKLIIPNNTAYGEVLGGRGSCGVEKGIGMTLWVELHDVRFIPACIWLNATSHICCVSQWRWSMNETADANASRALPELMT